MDFAWNCVEYVDASAAVDTGAAELVAAEGEGADHATGMSPCGSLESALILIVGRQRRQFGLPQ